MGEVNSAGSAPAPGAKGESPTTGRLKKEELRSAPRFKADDARAEVYLKGLLTTLGIGRTNEAREAINLSEGGILVLTHNKLKLGTRVHVRIENEKFKDVIEADGVVRWCCQSARAAGDFYAGVEFTNLARAQKALIAKMQAWYTSPEYKARTATRRRQNPLEL